MFWDLFLFVIELFAKDAYNEVVLLLQYFFKAINFCAGFAIFMNVI